MRKSANHDSDGSCERDDNERDAERLSFHERLLFAFSHCRRPLPRLEMG
jgi:hypothetical protein